MKKLILLSFAFGLFSGAASASTFPQVVATKDLAQEYKITPSIKMDHKLKRRNTQVINYIEPGSKVEFTVTPSVGAHWDNIRVKWGYSYHQLDCEETNNETLSCVALGLLHGGDDEVSVSAALEVLSSDGRAVIKTYQLGTVDMYFQRFFYEQYFNPFVRGWARFPELGRFVR
jgi:hypothetical protein